MMTRRYRRPGRDVWNVWPRRDGGFICAGVPRAGISAVVTPPRPGMPVSMPQTPDIASCAVSSRAKRGFGISGRASGERPAVGTPAPSPRGPTGSRSCRASAERLAAAASLSPRGAPTPLGGNGLRLPGITKDDLRVSVGRAPTVSG